MKALPVLLADVVNRADVGVIERRRGLGFALKPAQSLGIARDFVGKEFQRDETMQASVFGLVNHAHAAAPQLFDNPVVRDGLADHVGVALRRNAILWAYVAGVNPMSVSRATRLPSGETKAAWH